MASVVRSLLGNRMDGLHFYVYRKFIFEIVPSFNIFYLKKMNTRHIWWFLSGKNTDVMRKRSAVKKAKILKKKIVKDVQKHKKETDPPNMTDSSSPSRSILRVQ